MAANKAVKVKRTFELPPIEHFQERTDHALRERLRWLKQNLDLDDLFFAKSLGLPEWRFRNWAEGQATMLKRQRELLDDLTDLQLRVLSLYRFDGPKTMQLFEHVVNCRPENSHVPPWAGKSINKFIEQGRHRAVKAVMQWFDAVRFDDTF